MFFCFFKGRLIMVSVLGTVDIVLGFAIMYSVCAKKYVIFYSVGGDRKKQGKLFSLKE